MINSLNSNFILILVLSIFTLKDSLTITKTTYQNLISKLTNKIKLSFKNRPILIFSITSLIGCFFLNIGILKDYAFLDANEYIWTAYRNLNFQNEFIQGGRPLLGIICEYVYGTLCINISDLKWIRLLSLTGGVLFSIQIFSFLLKLKMKIFESALFSFLILTIPSFSVYFGWSATFEIPFLLNINFFAGLVLLKSFNRKKNRNINYLIAILLVVISLCIYQSAVTIFLLPLIFSFILTKNFSIKNVISILIFTCITFSIYFIVFKLSLHWHGLAPTNRTNIDLLKLPLRVMRFYLKEMRMLVKGSGFLILPVIFSIIGTLSFLGFLNSLYKKRKETPQFLLFFFWIILVLPLTYLPNLISADKFICSRTIAPAAILILFYQFNFFRQLSEKSKTMRGLSLILALSVIILGSINLNIYITQIRHKEYNALKTTFNKVPLDNTKEIFFIKPKNEFLQDFNFYKYESADEFGYISSSRLWVPEPLFNQILMERLDSLGLEKRAFPANKIKIYESGDQFNDDNAIVINIIDVLKKTFSQD